MAAVQGNCCGLASLRRFQGPRLASPARYGVQPSLRRKAAVVFCASSASSAQVASQYSVAVSKIPCGIIKLAALVVKQCNHATAVMQRAFSAQWLKNLCPGMDVTQLVNDLSVNQKLLNPKLLAVAAPFAKAASLDTEYVYFRTFEKAAYGFAKMYLFCLFMRVLLSWFSEIDWNVQPFTFLRMITEPYLQIYRGILPPLFGQLDFTPLFGFLILQDVVEVMTPVYTVGLHHTSNSTLWTTTDPLCYFDGH